MRSAPMFLALAFAAAGLCSGPARAQAQGAPATTAARSDTAPQQAARFEHQDNAIKARDLAQGPGGALRPVLQDPRLRWPDTFSEGPDGSLYVTTSRIQDSAFFNKDAPPALPTQLWRLPRPRD